MGRALIDKRSNKGSVTKTYQTSYAYNKDGSLNLLTYPSGDAVTYTVGGAGRVTQVSDASNNYVGYASPSTPATYAPTGALATMTQGHTSSFAGIVTADTYNDRLQPVLLSASVGGSAIFSLCYDFHLHVAISDPHCTMSAYSTGNNGNVYRVLNNLDSTRSTAYAYDYVNRIQQANTITTTGANCWGESYTIDPWGNFYARNGVSGMTGCAYEALAATPNTQNHLSTLLYDSAGNVTNDGNGNLPTYDTENRIATDAGVTYQYDADGTRIEKSSGTMYWPGPTGALTESDLSGTIIEEYIFFNGARIARIDRPSGTLHYYFSDQLSSASVVTDALGANPVRYYYYPYGGMQSTVGSDPNHYKFTGKERDTESNFDYFGARYYASTSGRFLEIDRKGRSAHQGDPQTWNRYAYVTNRPLIFVDPDGFEKYLVVYAEQPNPGTRDRQAGAFGTNLGHTFIGLRDTDTHKEVKVGFYPQAGSSLDVARGKTVPGEIKNNDQHSYNVEKDYKLTDKQYDSVVNSVKKDAKTPPNYNLYDENCTDWVIQKAAVAGVTLPSNGGGEGSPNNPADLGQDLSYQGGSPISYEGPDQGSSDSQDPQKTNDLTPLKNIPSSGVADADPDRDNINLAHQN